MNRNLFFMKFNIAIILIYIFSILAHSQDIITLKNGLVVEGEIAIVNSWGFNLKDNRPVQYKSVNTVVTNQKEIIKLVTGFLPTIEISTQNDSIYTLNFQNLKFTPTKPIPQKTFIFDEHHIITSISSLDVDRYNLELFSIFSNSFLLKIGFGYSEYPAQFIIYNNYPNSDWQSKLVHRTDRIYGPMFGLGTNVTFNNNALYLTYNYSFKILNRELDREIGLKKDEFDDAAYIEISFQTTSVWRELIISLGIRNYLNIIDFEDNDKTTALSLGIGWRFH